jgi:spermidine/putrescine transport system substrate-binding protein
VNNPVSRREALRRAGLLGAAGLSLPALVTACGGDDDGSSDTAPGTTGGTATTSGGGTSTTAGSGTTAAATTTAGSTAPLEGTLHILTWPLYIENDDPTTSPTLKNFSAATGVDVDYSSELDDNEAFYTKYQPDLAKGKGIGYDLVVPTSWMAARMIKEGLVQPLGPIPNRSNLRDDLASPNWDSTRQYSLPWAQGQTGISYFPDKTERPITSVADILDPKFKNRVSILSEWRDTVGLFMLDMGFDVNNPNMDEVKQAIDAIGQARDDGQFRKIVGNSYTDDLITGEVWIALAWSGDIATLKAADTPDIEYVLPAKGAMSFVDNMLIPVGAENKAAAEAYMNFVYDPNVSGPLFEAITYVSPVKGAADFMTDAGKANPFVNPPAGSKLYEFGDVTADQEAEIVELFAKATQL